MRDALIGLGLVAGALLACGRGERPAPPAASAASAALTLAPLAPPPPSASATPEQPTVVSSVATFSGDKLTACVAAVYRRDNLDLIRAKLAEDASAAAMSTQALADDDASGFVSGATTLFGRSLDRALGPGSARALRPPGKPTTIPKPCEEQFAGRTVVATCQVVARPEPNDAGLSFPVALGVTYYDALLGDAPMRGCLSAKGDWKELSHDSPERARERHRQLYEELRKDVGN
jgi:hypothetical protein